MYSVRRGEFISLALHIFLYFVAATFSEPLLAVLVILANSKTEADALTSNVYAGNGDSVENVDS